METTELLQPLKDKFRDGGLKSIKYIGNDKFRLSWDSELNLPNHILEVRPIKDNFSIGLLFEINTSTIVVKGEVYQYEYTGALTNLFEITELCEGYKIERLGKEYLRDYKVIKSDINGNIENKQLLIK